jgi:hypothetical protein
MGESVEPVVWRLVHGEIFQSTVLKKSEQWDIDLFE